MRHSLLSVLPARLLTIIILGLMPILTTPALAASVSPRTTPSTTQRSQSVHPTARSRRHRSPAPRRLVLPHVVVHGVRVSGTARSLLHDPVWLEHEAQLLRAGERQLLRQQRRDLHKLAVFGTVVSLSYGALIIHKISPVGVPAHARLAHVDPEPELGNGAGNVHVRLQPDTTIQVQGGLAHLSTGVPVLVGGSLLPHGALVARFVADLRQAHAPAHPHLHLVPGHLRHLFSIGVGPHSSASRRSSVRFRPRDTTQTANAGVLEFQGQFGGPSISDVEPLNTTFLNVSGFTVVLTKMVFNAALAGWSYDFPFAFSGTASNLADGQTSALNLTVTPTTPASDAQPTFIGGFGVSYDFTFEITTSSGTYTQDVPISLFTLTDTSFDAPPAYNQTWTVPATNCPNLSIGIPRVPMLNIFQMGLCFDFIFTGAPFIADLTASNGTVASPSKVCQRINGNTSPCFDGVDPTSFSVTPSTNPLTLTLNNFEYTPQTAFDLNLVFKAGVCPLACPTLGQIDTGAVQQGLFYGITTPFPYNSDYWFSGLLANAQPTSLSMTFATAPSLTSLSPSWGYAHYLPAGGDDHTTIQGAGFGGAAALTITQPDNSVFQCALAPIGSSSPGVCGTIVSDNEIDALLPPTITAHPGTYTIAVEVPCASCSNGQAAVSPVNGADVFTVVQPPPAITSVTPNRGPLAGNTQVVLTGYGLSNANQVWIGHTQINNFTVNSSTQITIPALPSSSSVQTLAIWVNDDCSGSNASAAYCGSSSATPLPNPAPGYGNTYSYLGAPGLTDIDPDRGPTAGGNPVTLYGFGFTTASKVELLNDQQWQSLPFTVSDDRHIAISSMPNLGIAGTVQLRVTTDCAGSNLGTATSCGTSNTYNYRYLPRPAITSVSPTSGPTNGGNVVVNKGSGFTTASEIDLAELPLGPNDTPTTFSIDSSDFTVDSDSQITIPSMPAPPYGNGGPVSMTVIATCLTPETAHATACGASQDETADVGLDYTYTPDPTISFSFNPPHDGYYSAADLPAIGMVTATSSGVMSSSMTCTGATLGNLSGASTHNLSGALSLSTEGANTVSCTASDAQGNTNTGSTVVRIDTTPPTITISYTDVNGNPISPNANGWFNQPVVAHFSCNDTLSGVFACPAPVTLSSDGANQSISVTARDNAGNTGHASALVNIDTTPPGNVTAAFSRLPDSNGWYNHSFSVTWSGQDSLSGIASCTTDTYTGPDTASGSLSGTCTDKAGNTSAAVAVTFEYDATPPTLAPIVSPSPALLNGSATVTPNASDALSGVATASCASFDLTTPGSKTVTCTATDKAGNTGQGQGAYQVQFASSGTCDGAAGHQVLSPINAEGSSVFKLGSTVSIKFRVCDVNGVSVGPTSANPTVVASFKQTAVNANPGAVVNETPISTTPDTVFRWDSTNQQWIFNLDTGDLSSGNSYTYQIALIDGTTITFSFSVR